MEHTPIPWRVVSGVTGAGMLAIEADYGGRALIASVAATDEAEANAAFIVQAVNAHQALVEALEGLVLRYVSLVDSGDCGFWNADDEPQMKAARAALNEIEHADGRRSSR